MNTNEYVTVRNLDYTAFAYGKIIDSNLITTKVSLLGKHDGEVFEFRNSSGLVNKGRGEWVLSPVRHASADEAKAEMEHQAGYLMDIERLNGVCDGWSESTPGGMLVNPKGCGGIIDREMVFGDWFVIFGDDRQALNGYESRAIAVEAFCLSVEFVGMKKAQLIERINNIADEYCGGKGGVWGIKSAKKMALVAYLVDLEIMISYRRKALQLVNGVPHLQMIAWDLGDGGPESYQEYGRLQMQARKIWAKGFQG